MRTVMVMGGAIRHAADLISTRRIANETLATLMVPRHWPNARLQSEKKWRRSNRMLQVTFSSSQTKYFPLELILCGRNGTANVERHERC